MSQPADKLHAFQMLDNAEMLESKRNDRGLEGNQKQGSCPQERTESSGSRSGGQLKSKAVFHREAF